MWSWEDYIRDKKKTMPVYGVVEKLLDDLTDRRGIGDEFDNCDAEVQREIIDAMANIIEENVTPAIISSN
jgi:hypothetical protein